MALGSPPIQDTFDMGSRPRATWSTWLLNLFGVVKYIGNSDVSVPTTGFAYTVPDTVELVTFDPVGTLSTGSVTLPGSATNGPTSGRKVYIHSTKQITTLTVSASPGTTISTAFASTLAANTGIAYYFNSAKLKWYRFQ